VSGAVWTITPAATGITCTAAAPFESCTAAGSNAVTQGTYTLIASYPGTTITGTAQINVGP
jgi:hypothetical protein